MKLFGYWRSSATYRVRIALNLKRLDYDYEPVNLLAGEQHAPAYKKANPQGLVPALVTDDGVMLTQSLAIIEYLEEAYPENPLLPSNAIGRAKARGIASTLASEAQPFMNLRIQKYLKGDLSLDEDAMQKWLNTWPGGAMSAVEALLEETSGKFCIGDEPGLADAFLVPQWFGAARFGVDMTGFPKGNEIFERCQSHPAFVKAHPENQPDAVATS